MKQRRSPHTTMKGCSHPGCDNSIPDHGWGHIKADDWFFEKSGKAWCPDHHPAWVAAWRARKAAN